MFLTLSIGLSQVVLVDAAERGLLVPLEDLGIDIDAYMKQAFLTISCEPRCS